MIMKKLFGLFLLIILIALSGCGGGSHKAASREFSADAHTVALWHFNESSGQTVADSSGNSLDLFLGWNGTVEGNDPAWIDSGHSGFGNCLAFTASESDIAHRNSGNSFPSNTVTVECWVKRSSSAQASIFSSSGGGFEVILMNTGEIWFIVNMNSCISSSSINNDQWHYVACTYDHAIMRIYIDGVKDSAENALVADVPTSVEYYVGGRNTFLDGYMDEIRISDTVRTGQEISDYYQRATE